ncbi:hypothetical protein RRG08_047569 [Elysia crispata]|uniref:Uncharacterized protein n=1 Tax=Elysia crispata TaxID=231223 RepID=A0AAE0YP24_9GAST|nr:hypothetical protein RRG08_047569 [Elysia crispata]
MACNARSPPPHSCHSITQPRYRSKPWKASGGYRYCWQTDRPKVTYFTGYCGPDQNSLKQAVAKNGCSLRNEGFVVNRPHIDEPASLQVNRPHIDEPASHR